MQSAVYTIKPVPTSHTHSIFSKVLFSLRILLVYTLSLVILSKWFYQFCVHLYYYAKNSQTWGSLGCDNKN
jgi:hypothetical protein